jgi:hypothetical protein
VAEQDANRIFLIFAFLGIQKHFSLFYLKNGILFVDGKLIGKKVQGLGMD